MVMEVIEETLEKGTPFNLLSVLKNLKRLFVHFQSERRDLYIRRFLCSNELHFLLRVRLIYTEQKMQLQGASTTCYVALSPKAEGDAWNCVQGCLLAATSEAKHQARLFCRLKLQPSLLSLLSFATSALAALGLGQNNFKGEIPPSLGNFSSLIPEELGRLTRLQYLIMADNNLHLASITSRPS
ncbi:hypothetical protein Q3G72_012291 [Acer saccharum]|nr:hypothetical protein Q3G72_012291 [Acer saccharum]